MVLPVWVFTIPSCGVPRELRDAEVEHLRAQTAGLIVRIKRMLSGFRSRWTDPLGVRRADGARDLPRDRQRHLGGSPSPTPIAGATSVEELHDEERRAVRGISEVEHIDEARVPGRGVARASLRSGR